MTERRYRKTFLDRHGPEGALTGQVLVRSLVSVPLSFIVVGYLIQGLRVKPLVALLLVVLGIAAGYALTVWGIFTIMRLAAAPAARIYGGGNASPYEEQYSQEQALVMQRRVDEALASYEHRIAFEPRNVAARTRAADLYATQGGNPHRAAELFREVQRIPGITASEGVYACNRLADLYLGPLNEPGRAIVELRRLIDSYPSTPGAAQARIALAELKARLHAATDDNERRETT